VSSSWRHFEDQQTALESVDRGRQTKGRAVYQRLRKASQNGSGMLSKIKTRVDGIAALRREGAPNESALLQIGVNSPIVERAGLIGVRSSFNCKTTLSCIA